MTTLLVIRHAAHDLLGRRLAGRMDGVPLNETGLRQATQLAESLHGRPLAALYSSPLERALQTAGPLAAWTGRPVLTRSALNDIEFGGWTGQTFEQLQSDPEWITWCDHRSAAQPPEGETIEEVQKRMVDELRQLAALHPHGTIAIFSHCDVIKAALAYFLSLSLDALERFEIAPASISVLVMEGRWTQVRLVNGGPVVPIG